MKHLIALAAGLSLTLAACTQKSPTFDPQRLSGHVKTLSSDEFEGRGPDTAGEQKTVEYLIGQMQSAKLSPGGDLVDGQRGWTQAVPLGRFEITGPIRLELTAAGKTQALTQGEEIAVRAAMNGSSGVKFDSVPLVFVGYGVHAPERQWDDFKGVDLQGKIGIVLVNDPDFEAGTGDFGGKAMTYYGRWTYKYEIASEKGAAAAIIVHETGPAGYPWDVVAGSWGRENFDIRSPNADPNRVRVESWITEPKARELFSAAGQDFDALKAQARTQEFRPVTLSGTASFRLRNTIREVESRNVVGRLQGSDPELRDEYVVFTAHWDHLGRDTTAEGDQIYNGALDNASGTAGMVEIAKAFRALPAAPRRSILFLAVTAEEQGLLGAKYYAENPLYPLTHTVANINIDGVNQWGRTEDVVIVGRGNSTLEDMLGVVTAGERTLADDPEPEKGFYYRSDHFEFAKQGVPAIYIDNGTQYIGRDPSYGEEKREQYTANDYHKPSDEMKPDWDLAGAVEDLQMLFRLGVLVANEDAIPEWKEGTEFKARRDSMMVGRN